MSSNYTACCLNWAKSHTKKSLLSGQKIKPNSDYRKLINPTWINLLPAKPTGIGQVPTKPIQHELAAKTNSSLELIPKINYTREPIPKINWPNWVSFCPFYSLRRAPEEGSEALEERLRDSGRRLQAPKEGCEGSAGLRGRLRGLPRPPEEGCGLWKAAKEKLINPICKLNPITVQKMKFISHYLTFLTIVCPRTVFRRLAK